MSNYTKNLREALNNLQPYLKNSPMVEDIVSAIVEEAIERSYDLGWASGQEYVYDIIDGIER